ncbi:MAG: hypothetical protein Q7U16_16910 [Agitococcus sp.]|nr:hypothetical protein [Agitococcus sp.]
MTYYFKGFCRGGNDEGKHFTVELDSFNRMRMGEEIFSEVIQYVHEHDELELPYEDSEGCMPCDDEWGDRKPGCRYVYVSMEESNMFDDNEDFQTFWEDVLDIICNNKYRKNRGQL